MHIYLSISVCVHVCVNSVRVCVRTDRHTCSPCQQKEKENI